jgi:hypothetical protein
VIGKGLGKGLGEGLGNGRSLIIQQQFKSKKTFP